MLTKNYLESEYKQAIREFKAAIDENAQWEARKSMAKLEMIAGQMYGFDYMDELHKLTDEITNETTKKITETTIDQRFIERYFEAQYKEAIIEFKSAPSKEYQQCARLRMSLIEQAALEKYSLEFSNKLHELAAKELDNQGRIKVYTYRRQHNDYIFIPPDRGIGEAKEYIEEDEKNHITLDHILEEVQYKRNTVLVVSSIHALGNTSEEILSRLAFLRNNSIPTIISQIEESWRIFHDPISPAAARFTLNMIINTIHAIYDAPKYPSYFNYSMFTKDIIRQQKETITTEYRKSIQAFKELTWSLEDEENQTAEDIKYVKKLRDAHLKNLAELENYAEDIIDRDFRNRMHDELDRLYWYTQDDDEKLNAFRQEEKNK